jgi:hypothetical protein
MFSSFARLLCVPCILAYGLVLAPTASAQLFRAYLSATGNDANPCTVSMPCRLLPAALNVVASGGEIWMLDSANYNTSAVTITKSVTILAVPGALGSITAGAGSVGLGINAPNGAVSLRNLVFIKLGGIFDPRTGVLFQQGAKLDISSCEFANFSVVFPSAAFAIYANAPGGKLVISDSTIRDGYYALYMFDTVSATLDRVRIHNHDSLAIRAGPGSTLTVNDSVITGNDVAIEADGNARVVIARTVLTHNETEAIAALATQPGNVVQVTVSQSIISHNPGTGIRVDQALSSSATVTLDGNTVTNNGIGVSFTGASVGTVFSRGNNTIQQNGTDYTGGSLTVLGGA